MTDKLTQEEVITFLESRGWEKSGSSADWDDWWHVDTVAMVRKGTHGTGDGIGVFPDECDDAQFRHCQTLYEALGRESVTQRDILLAYVRGSQDAVDSPTPLAAGIYAHPSSLKAHKAEHDSTLASALLTGIAIHEREFIAPGQWMLVDRRGRVIAVNGHPACESGGR